MRRVTPHDVYIRRRAAHRRRDLDRLRVAAGDRLITVTDTGDTFAAQAASGDGITGRFQVVAAWINGYRTAATIHARGIDQINDQIQTWVNDHADTVPADLEKLLALLDLVINDL